MPEEDNNQKRKVTKITKIINTDEDNSCCSDENPWMGRIIFTLANIIFFAANLTLIIVIIKPLIYEQLFLSIVIPWFLLTEFFFCMAMWSYLTAAFSDPGFMPKDLRVPNLDGIADFPVKEYFNEISNEASQDGLPRWRPPRCYWCPACKATVFKQDHHCVWINNCVGAGNAKFFAQF